VIQYPAARTVTFIVLLIKRQSESWRLLRARFRRINGGKLSVRRKKRSSEIRELSHADYGRIVARLTPFRGGTRFALSVSPRWGQPRSDNPPCRVLHIKGFSVFFPFLSLASSRSSLRADSSAAIRTRRSTCHGDRRSITANTLTKFSTSYFVELDVYTRAFPQEPSVDLRRAEGDTSR